MIPKDDYTRTARVLRAVDGDTLEVAIDLGYCVWSMPQTVRLMRVNCDEMHAHDAAERARAAQARDFAARLEGQTVTIRTFKATDRAKDSFRRWLAEVWYVQGIGDDAAKNLSDELLSLGLGRPYQK